MATRRPAGHKYVLTLYVAGASPAALRAVEQIHALSRDELDGDVTLRVVDLGEHLDDGAVHGVIATPTLVRELPLPVKLLVGRLVADQLLAGIRIDDVEDVPS